AIDAGACADLEIVGLGVAPEVLEQVVARDPAAVPARDAQAGEPGEEPRRVQPQPVVAHAPGRPRLGSLLEHQRAQSLAAQESGGGETGRTAADDRDLAGIHGRGHTTVAYRAEARAMQCRWPCELHTRRLD